MGFASIHSLISLAEGADRLGKVFHTRIHEPLLFRSRIFTHWAVYTYLRHLPVFVANIYVFHFVIPYINRLIISIDLIDFAWPSSQAPG